MMMGFAVKLGGFVLPVIVVFIILLSLASPHFTKRLPAERNFRQTILLHSRDKSTKMSHERNTAKRSRSTAPFLQVNLDYSFNSTITTVSVSSGSTGSGPRLTKQMPG